MKTSADLLQVSHHGKSCPGKLSRPFVQANCQALTLLMCCGVTDHIHIVLHILLCKRILLETKKNTPVVLFDLMQVKYVDLMRVIQH